MVLGRLRSLGVAVVAVLVAACASTPASPPPATPTPGLYLPSPTPAAGASGAASPAAPSAGTLPRPIGDVGAIAVLAEDGALAVLGADGRSAIIAPANPSYVFPAWSPDGTRLATVRTEADGTDLAIHDVAAALSGDPVPPTIVFHHPTMRPFYLSWTPDGSAVTYLAADEAGLALRIAPADASSPTDGTETSSIIRSGDPFYYDWIGPDALVAHVGTGEGAFLGEIDLLGASTAPAIERPAHFRSPVVSPDGTYLAYALVDADGSSVVVQPRDGGDAVSMPIHAMTAVAFDPAGITVAALGADQPVEEQLEIPVGPLRLLDPGTGEARTLIDGAVVAFWWAPDGQTIAALRVQRIDGNTTGQNEVRLLFVDVASGDVRSQSPVRPGQLFIDQLVTFFDQYARSHRVWAPDGSTFLMPAIDASGATRLVAFDPDGGDPLAIDGIVGFWSPT